MSATVTNIAFTFKIEWESSALQIAVSCTYTEVVASRELFESNLDQNKIK